MSARKPYPSDLTDLQWHNIHHLFPGGDRPPRSPGRPRIYDLKEIVDTIFYLARTGSQWRSFGCHSADGCRFVERILTVVETLRQQKRSVLTFLQDAIMAYRAGLLPPRLLTQ